MDGEGDDAVGASRARRAIAAVDRHPVVVSVAIAILVAAAHVWWIWTNRHLGGFDPDESSYLSSALRIHRKLDLLHPLEVVKAVAGTGHGISSPSFSLPFLLVGPRDPRTAMMLQPVLLVFIAAAVAAITRRLANSWAAIFAATLVVALPTVTTAVQSYWYGLSAAATMAGALWALLASERGNNRRIWWYGVGIGLMLLSRTMTLGYLPACGLAGLVVAFGDRRGLRRVVAAGALGVAIAAPWYLVNRETIFEYLFSFGYGKRAALFGKTGFGDRLSLRWDRYTYGMSLPGWWLTTLLVLCVGLALWAWRGTGPRSLAVRSWLAVGASVVAGTAALVSTANNGVWFELPLVVLLVPVLVAAVAQVPRPLAVLTGVAMVVGIWSELPQSFWWTTWQPTHRDSHYEWGFSEYDERFRPDTRDLHERAAADWWSVSSAVERTMRRIAPEGPEAEFVITGNTQLFNAGTVQMAAELDGWETTVIIPNTTLSARERADYLRSRIPSGPERTERVLVVGLHDLILWPLDVEVRSFVAQARRDGYEEWKRFPLPRGGDVVMFRKDR